MGVPRLNMASGGYSWLQVSLFVVRAQIVEDQFRHVIVSRHGCQTIQMQLQRMSHKSRVTSVPYPLTTWVTFGTQK